MKLASAGRCARWRSAWCLLLVPPLYGVITLFVVLMRVTQRCNAGDATRAMRRG